MVMTEISAIRRIANTTSADDLDAASSRETLGGVELDFGEGIEVDQPFSDGLNGFGDQRLAPRDSLQQQIVDQSKIYFSSTP